jgi:hypothetical protein
MPGFYQDGTDAAHRPLQCSVIYQSTRHREILLPGVIPTQPSRPIRSETRTTLVASIAQGRRWLE